MILTFVMGSRVFAVCVSPFRDCSAFWLQVKHGKPFSKAYPYLQTEDIDEALRYAAFLAEDETIELIG